MEKLWPYVLPLPIEEGEQSKILFSLFKSKASIDIMKYMRMEGATYQRDMIKKLPYSNKTIIEHLATLVSANVLIEGMEKSKEKRAWIKWYTPTPLGRWIQLLLMPPQKVPKNKINDLLNDLLKLQVEGAVKLCLKYKLDPDTLKTSFMETYEKTIADLKS